MSNQEFEGDMSAKENTEYTKIYNEVDAGGKLTFFNSIKIMLFSSYLNLFLLAIPIASITYFMDLSDIATFIFSVIALAPLSERLSLLTEQIAIHTNDAIGGLLNVTLGNATELIVCFVALKKGLFRLIQLSLLGSVLSNLLLVLGTSFLAGGYYHKILTFDNISSQVNSTLLMLGAMAMIFPTVLTESKEENSWGEVGYSRGASLCLFVSYFGFIYFQLISHKFLYDDEPPTAANPPVDATTRGDDTMNPLTDQRNRNNHNDSNSSNNSSISSSATATSEKALENSLIGDDNDNDNDSEEEDLLGFNYAILWLIIVAGFIALVSEFLTSSIEDAADGAGISRVFLATVILPIVGNAAEHFGAVLFAMKGKSDLAIEVAVGSGTQVLVCVLPLLVIIAWICDLDLSLNLGAFESIALVLTIVMVTFAIKDGKATWLTGLQLIMAFIIFSIAFAFHEDEDLSNKHPYSKH